MLNLKNMDPLAQKKTKHGPHLIASSGQSLFLKSLTAMMIMITAHGQKKGESVATKEV
jgi:hypothetical protein